MVPSRQLLISITFLTVWLAIQFPAVALESVATMMPPWKRKAKVVVPCASLIGQLGFEWSSVVARRKAEGYVREVSFGHRRCYLRCEVCGDPAHTCAIGGKANFSDSDGVGSESSWYSSRE